MNDNDYDSPRQQEIKVQILYEEPLYEDATVNSPIIRKIKSGDTVTITGEKGDFYEVKYKIGFDADLPGFINKNNLDKYLYAQMMGAISGEAEANRTSTVKRAVISHDDIIYTSPSVESAIVYKISKGDNLTVLDESGDFFLVKLESERDITGYVRRESLYQSCEEEIERINTIDHKEDLHSQSNYSGHSKESAPDRQTIGTSGRTNNGIWYAPRIFVPMPWGEAFSRAFKHIFALIGWIILFGILVGIGFGITVWGGFSSRDENWIIIILGGLFILAGAIGLIAAGMAVFIKTITDAVAENVNRNSPIR